MCEQTINKSHIGPGGPAKKFIVLTYTEVSGSPSSCSVYVHLQINGSIKLWWWVNWQHQYFIFASILWICNHQLCNLLWDFQNPLRARVPPKCTKPELSSMEFQDPKGTRVSLKCTSPDRPLHNWFLKTQYLNLSSDIGIVRRGDHPAIGSCYKPSLMTGHKSQCQTLDKNKYKIKSKSKKIMISFVCP